MMFDVFVRYTDKPVTERRLQDCVDVLLTMQNKNGGVASYELVRGGSYMEWLNCAEVFGECIPILTIQCSKPGSRSYKAIS